MKYLTRQGAIAYLRANGFPCGSNLLAKLAITGEGPQFRYWGRRTIYTEDDLNAWMKSRLSPPVSSTSGKAGYNDELIAEPSKSLLSRPTRRTRRRRKPVPQSLEQAREEHA